MIFACVVLQEFIQRRFNAIKGISIVLTGDRLFMPVRREPLVFPPLVFVVLRRGKSAEARGHGGLTPDRSPDSISVYVAGHQKILAQRQMSADLRSRAAPSARVRYGGEASHTA